MEIFVLAFIILFVVYCIGTQYFDNMENETNSTSKASSSGGTPAFSIVKKQSGSETKTAASSSPASSQKPAIKKTVPPTGRRLSWNDEADIAFAIGCLIAAFDAVGSITACHVETSGNGLLRFYIILPSVTYGKLRERVPSDVMDFLEDNPQILSEKASEITLEIEKSFFIALRKTPENISNATNGMLKLVQRNAKEGAIKTAELTGMRNLRPIRLEIEGNYWHRSIRINMH